jgi:glycosyltransferase involved in cell wall biosynthesis
MKVFINALALRSGGGQTHLYNLLSELPEGTEHDFILLAPLSFKHPGNNSRLKRIFPLGIRWIEYPVLRLPWELIVLPVLLLVLRVDTVFAPGGIYVGPRFGWRVVTACQNMMPFDYIQRAKYPFGYMKLRTRLLESAFLKSFARSDLIVFISEYAKTRVFELLKVSNPPKFLIAPPTLNEVFLRQADQKLDRPVWAPPEYVLYVSTLDVYKAQVEVVRAFAKLIKKNPETKVKLLLVGSEYPPYGQEVRSEIERCCIKDRVQIQGPIPHRDLPALYQSALINLFASECENGPNILLEAMASGRPLLASNRAPMPEFGGNVVRYFDPSDVDGLAELLEDEIHKYRVKTFDPVPLLSRAEIYVTNKSGRSIWNAITSLTINNSSTSQSQEKITYDQVP